MLKDEQTNGDLGEEGSKQEDNIQENSNHSTSV